MSGSTIEELAARVARLEGWARSFAGGAPRPAAASAPTSAPKAAAPVGDVASDAELDAKYGDPEIRKDPSRWEGASYVGRRYSQTEPAYLDSLAGFLAWKASKNQEEGDPARAKFIAFDRRDAKLARGWARRLRARAAPPPDPDDGPDGFGEHGAPF